MSSNLDVSQYAELQKVLQKYKDLVEIDIRLILNAYKLQKPLTGIEIDEEPILRVREFVARMRDFFFVEMWECPRLAYKPGKFNGSVFVSRFKTLPTLATQYDGLSDIYSDLAGVMYGYPLREIADYCRRITPDQFK